MAILPPRAQDPIGTVGRGQDIPETSDTRGWKRKPGQEVMVEGSRERHPGGPNEGAMVLPTLAFNGLLQSIVQATQGTDPSSGVITLGPVMIYYGAGSPAGVVVADIGSLYLDLVTGGTTLYVKQGNSGTSNGWVGK